METLYLFLGNLQISMQVLLWLLSFYWLDLDLFTYLFNNNIILKFILGVILICSQIYLYQYLYYLVIIDSVFEKENESELQNINEKHEYTTCKKCNILRPKRAHHCRYCNKCILKMDHHCFTLNKCIGENNYYFFVRYLIFAELNASYVFWITLYVCLNYYSQLYTYDLIKYGILILVSFMGTCGLFFYLIFLIYLNIVKLTTLEFMYPSLRIKSPVGKEIEK